MAKYIDLTHNKGTALTQVGREEGIRRLMSINLLKRLESSVYAFRLTLQRIRELITKTIETNLRIPWRREAPGFAGCWHRS